MSQNQYKSEYQNAVKSLKDPRKPHLYDGDGNWLGNDEELLSKAAVLALLNAPQEAVAWAEVYEGKVYGIALQETRFHTEPLVLASPVVATTDNAALVDVAYCEVMRRQKDMQQRVPVQMTEREIGRREGRQEAYRDCLAVFRTVFGLRIGDNLASCPAEATSREPMTDDDMQRVLGASSVNSLIRRIVRSVEHHHGITPKASES